ncbi:MAG: hypothetical protein JNK38_01930 [Acidobacteria bacterium]|nr:hypothetical protein [Acidobacteriota bacterium]
MPAANVVKVLKQVAMLTAEEKRELLALMSQPALTNGVSEQETENGIATETVSSYDHTPRLRWLKQYVADYAGQYIAMDGDKLLAHGTDPEKVFAELQRHCPPVPYFGYIPATDESPMLGANLTL